DHLHLPLLLGPTKARRARLPAGRRAALDQNRDSLVALSCGGRRREPLAKGLPSLETSSRADGVGTEDNGQVSSPEPMPQEPSSGADPATSGFGLTAERRPTVRVSEVRVSELDPADVRGFHLRQP